MSKNYFCRKCEIDYSLEERNKSMFCPKCGTCLIDKSKIDPYYLRPANPETVVLNINLEVDFKNVYLPENHKKKLIVAHQIGSRILKNAGEDPEPVETALAVEEYRWFWKPKNVKFALVAESHVRTSAEELKVRIIPERLPSIYPTNGSLGFVKLVYCLGYGESNILDFPNRIKNNPGTKQYIDLFADLIGLKHQRNYMTRLKYRTNVLNTVKKQGIWLLDASVHACYMGNKKSYPTEVVKKRLPNKVVKKIVPMSWDRYVRPMIDDLDIDPTCVWIIGKGLSNLLEGKYARGSNWIYQPNAMVSGESKELRKKKLRSAITQCCL
ncbi:hypothetical protein JJE00_02230 [Candidatus Bathyarchaeota archaeon]|nr:hypothetical protein [Candidatus Bathyarchaeota archaeon]